MTEGLEKTPGEVLLELEETSLELKFPEELHSFTLNEEQIKVFAKLLDKLSEPEKKLVSPFKGKSIQNQMNIQELQFLLHSIFLNSEE